MSSLRQYEDRLRSSCEAVGYEFKPDWDFLERLYTAGFLEICLSKEGVALWQISQLLHDATVKVAVQVTLWEPPGPRRGERYVRLLRQSEEILAELGVIAIVGVSKGHGVGGLGPVFRRVGWTPEEQSYRKDLTGWSEK